MIGILSSLVSALKSTVSTRRRKIITGLTIVGIVALILYLLLHGQHQTVTPPPTGCTTNCGGNGGNTTPPPPTTTPPPTTPPPHPHPPPTAHHGNTEFAETRGMGHHTGIEKWEVRHGTEDDALSQYLKSCSK